MPKGRKTTTKTRFDEWFSIDLDTCGKQDWEFFAPLKNEKNKIGSSSLPSLREDGQKNLLLFVAVCVCAVVCYCGRP
jgi:hypothetical protein